VKANTQALVRLAQIFDAHGLHVAADIVDGNMMRFARLDGDDISPAHDRVTEKYKKIFDEEFRKRYKVKPGDSNFTSYRNAESYWIMPDGSVVTLEGARHGDALSQIEFGVKNDKGVRIHKDPEYQDFADRYYNGYHMVANTLGAIRVYAEFRNMIVVTAYTVPTPAQINTIDNLKQHWGTNKLNIEQFGHVIGHMAQFTNIPEWENALEQYERSKRSSGEAPKSSDFKDTMHRVDEANQSDVPYWRAKERSNIEQQYPGDEMAPLRKMYERSAGIKTANQLELDFDDNQDHVEEGRALLKTAWETDYPPVAANNDVSHSDGGMHKGSQSFWVFPDGRRIELGTTWHGTALRKLLVEHNLEDHPGVKQMRSDSGNDYYKMMGHNYGAIRIYAYSNTMGGSVHAPPTQEQMHTLQMIKDGLGLDYVGIEYTYPDGSYKYISSLEELAEQAVKPKAQRKIDDVVSEIDNAQSGFPLWKVKDRRRLQEEYPGEANAPLRRLYEQSAGTSTPNMRFSSRDNYYRQALEEGHKSKFKVLDPEDTPGPFRNMHSFWLYPDGRIMDLGKKWHDEAFNEVMQEARLDEEEEFGQMYSSKDGPHEIMSDYFGMIRLFIQDKNVLVVTSYRKPTQQQIDQIQNISHQSGRNTLKIEQYGFVPSGKLITNSMNKWVDELSKYNPNAKAQSSYNKMLSDVDEANELASSEPYSKARERQNLETNYPGPDNEKLRKMYERSAGNGS